MATDGDTPMGRKINMATCTVNLASCALSRCFWVLLRNDRMARCDTMNICWRRVSCVQPEGQYLSVQLRRRWKRVRRFNVSVLRTWCLCDCDATDNVNLINDVGQLRQDEVVSRGVVTRVAYVTRITHIIVDDRAE